ncbi:hypothetical protein AB0E62_37000 [Streptomyces sp. NPDC038707]|uniref:hypothetical protein n=1 Tax=Streptomyces sp. NPDC038707 TaxID=3154329 RepID=UPI0033E9982A
MPHDPQPLDLDAIDAVIAAATSGPWEMELEQCDCSDGLCSHGTYVSAVYANGERRNDFVDFPDADWQFAVRARAAMPAMAAEIRRLRAELATAQAQHAFTLRQRNNRSRRLLHLRDLAKAGDPNVLTAAALDTLAASRDDHPPAVETHVVADDSDDPEHVDDYPGYTRPCGHTDYHDPHEWFERPSVWCPGISYADDEPAARP